jgi:hypothetical protein
MKSLVAFVKILISYLKSRKLAFVILLQRKRNIDQEDTLYKYLMWQAQGDFLMGEPRFVPFSETRHLPVLQTLQ